MRYWPLRYMSDMIGGKFEASNRLDFKHSELLYQIVDTPKTNYNAVSCTPKQKYRYVRFTAAKDRYAQLGELLLFRFTNKKEKIASERYLDFNNVPKNALLWLRNLSHGKEEQVFWMENGKQIF